MGPAQREIERAGISTIAFSAVPDLTSATSVPRLAGIEHPFGQTMGKAGDAGTQRAALLAALEAAAAITTPGSTVHLPFSWTGTRKEAKAGPKVPPPIVGYLKWHPWELPRLFSRDVSR